MLSGYLDRLLEGLSVTELFQVSNDIKKTFDLTNGIKESLKEAASYLKGYNKRVFMAKTVCAFGSGGQRLAETELNWNRKTIRKGMHELHSGVECIDNFKSRGRNRVEKTILPTLLNDIIDIVKPSSQADPTFQTTKIYTPITAKVVHQCLLDEKGYTHSELPTIRTINSKLNECNFFQQTVAKCLPLKKIAETDAIFDEVHRVNKEADALSGVLRISMDSKAKVKIGQFSRGGKNRQGAKALDHDFAPDWILSLFGIHLPLYDQSYFFFNKSKDTADFTVDCLQELWPAMKEIYNPHTLVINLDNGPECNSHRTQFIKRIVDFAHETLVNIKLAYYPPYHSKYNPIERVWGVLENHWRGEILYTIDKALGLASSMTYNMINPEVELIDTEYRNGVTLDKKEMAHYESKIQRMVGLEKWFVDIIVKPILCDTIFAPDLIVA